MLKKIKGLKKKRNLSDLGTCDSSKGCCKPNSNMPRREFVKLSSLGAAFAMPLSACDFVSKTKCGHLIPADKMLSARMGKITNGTRYTRSIFFLEMMS